MTREYNTGTVEQRVWARIEKRGPDECWLWRGASDPGGYAVMNIKGRKTRVTRLLWEQVHGAIPPGLLVRHTCDNPPCCSPAHHLLGTHADNMQDMHRRGRWHYSPTPARVRPGERNPNAKITAADVAAIRAEKAAGATYTELAARWPLSRGQLCRIVTGKRWAHA